jgi:hypothetical protein
MLLVLSWNSGLQVAFILGQVIQMAPVDKLIRKQFAYFSAVQLAFMLHRKGVYTDIIIQLAILDKTHLSKRMLDLRQWSFNFPTSYIWPQWTRCWESTRFPRFCQEVTVFCKCSGSESVLTSILHLTVVVLCASNFKPVLLVLPHPLHKGLQLI